MRKLGTLYLGYAGVVGGALLALALTATQAAHSGADALLAVVLGVIAPVPMLLVGFCVWRRWKAAPLLSIAAPIALGWSVAQVWGRPQPPLAAGLASSFVFNAEYSQLYFLPGAIVLGVMVAAEVLWPGRRRGDRAAG